MDSRYHSQKFQWESKANGEFLYDVSQNEVDKHTFSDLLTFGRAALAQQGGRGRNAPVPGPSHDPHDLSGIWLGRAATALNNPPPSFTPAGKVAFDANKPSFGPRAVPPAFGNDPLGGADPPGIPRGLISHPTKIKFIPLPDKVVQLVEWNRVWREIWTDGIRLPEDPDLAAKVRLGREGWTKRQFKAGDQITITVFPSKAGTSVGVVDRTHPILANGKEVVAANSRNVD